MIKINLICVVCMLKKSKFLQLKLTLIKIIAHFCTTKKKLEKQILCATFVKVRNISMKLKFDLFSITICTETIFSLRNTIYSY